MDAEGRTVYEALADHFQLDSMAREQEIFEADGTPRTKWNNMVRWARNDLRKLGRLYSPSRGVWTITQEGIEYLEKIDPELVEQGLTREGTSVSPKELQEQLIAAQELGLAGEIHVLQVERERLVEAGRADLANAIEHTALINVAAGYDIHSYDDDGSDRFIEVKTTRGESLTFFITGNEWSTARIHRQHYWVYRVFLQSTTRIVPVRDPWGEYKEGNLRIVPTTFRVEPTERQ